MARFTAPVKWNDEWFSNLKPIEKLVFLYLTDRCDNGGFFEINKRVDAFLIGISETEFIDNLKIIRKCYVASKDGKKIWLKNYLRHQKNLPLNPENNAHKQIINIIKSNIENFEYDFNILGANQGLNSPIGKGNIIGKGKGKVEEGGMGETKMEDSLWTEVVKNFHSDFRWKEKFCIDKNLDIKTLEKKMTEFVSNIELRDDFKTLRELKNHFTNTYNKYGLNGNKGGINAKGSGIAGTDTIESDRKYEGLRDRT